MREDSTTFRCIYEPMEDLFPAEKRRRTLFYKLLICQSSRIKSDTIQDYSGNTACRQIHPQDIERTSALFRLGQGESLVYLIEHGSIQIDK